METGIGGTAVHQFQAITRHIFAQQRFFYIGLTGIPLLRLGIEVAGHRRFAFRGSAPFQVKKVGLEFFRCSIEEELTAVDSYSPNFR